MKSLIYSKSPLTRPLVISAHRLLDINMPEPRKKSRHFQKCFLFSEIRKNDIFTSDGVMVEGIVMNGQNEGTNMRKINFSGTNFVAFINSGKLICKATY